MQRHNLLQWRNQHRPIFAEACGKLRREALRLRGGTGENQNGSGVGQ
jgi:hypothetical protein